ncbi:MAG: hypothetical protein BWX81_02474 [Spirochaetes bacterium ADurb.Bin110]|nr:MAG: hypothetical protein BWX81_02474 [Spirochaetes bacterium ADurb.Bin110]
MLYTMVFVTLSNNSNNDMTPSKEQDHKQGYIVAIIIFLAIIFIVWKGPTLQYNSMRLYFPDKKKGELRLEKRPIAPIGTLEEKAQATVEELLLGPLSRDLKPLTRLDIKLLRIVEGKNALFLDFSTQDVTRISSEYKTFKSALEKSLKDTIPGTFHIYIFINGILAR